MHLDATNKKDTIIAHRYAFRIDSKRDIILPKRRIEQLRVAKVVGQLLQLIGCKSILIVQNMIMSRPCSSLQDSSFQLKTQGTRLFQISVSNMFLQTTERESMSSIYKNTSPKLIELSFFFNGTFGRVGYFAENRFLVHAQR